MHIDYSSIHLMYYLLFVRVPCGSHFKNLPVRQKHQAGPGATSRPRSPKASDVLEDVELEREVMKNTFWGCH